MIGEGTIRRLMHSKYEVLQIDQYENNVGLLLKVGNDYVKIIVRILKSGFNVNLLAKNNYSIFQEENREVLEFLSAEYIVHHHQITEKFDSERYKQKEFQIKSTIMISDDWLNQQTNAGTNLIKFEKYLEERNA